MKRVLYLLSIWMLCLALTAFAGNAMAASASIPYINEAGAAQSPETCVLITADHPVTELESDWYAVQGDVTLSNMTVTGYVNLILCDGCTLTVNGGILIYRTASLVLWSQSTGNSMGKLIATGQDNAAGIGGNLSYSAGQILIHGGNITATGGKEAAGIGGGSPQHGNESSWMIRISGGIVHATGGEYASGIGGGRKQANGNIEITGGTVTATGNSYGAGIGGGDEGNWGTITISGGTVTASGGSGSGAGIGGCNGCNGGDVTINGGSVTATGGTDGGAGIGGGAGPSGGNLVGTVTISGGTVTATGGNGGAGIGGGAAGNAGDGRVKISGGTVTAIGKKGAAGIGGGAETFGWGGEGAAVEITGGTVIAQSGEGKSSAIGHGDDDEHFGTITFADNMMVRGGWSAEECDNSTPFTSDAREAGCQYRWYARVEACTHPAPTYDIFPEYHQRTCSYCITEFPPVNHIYPEGKSFCSECGYNYGEVTVIYVLNNGMDPVMVRCNANTSDNLLPSAGDYPAPDGKILAGWNILKNNWEIREFLPPGAHFFTGLEQSITIEAVWADRITITFDGYRYDEDHAGFINIDGELLETFTQDVAKGSTYTIPDFGMEWHNYTMDGSMKTFHGWVQEGSSHIRQAGYSFAVLEDTAFSAVWDVFQVSFDSAGGSDVPAQEIACLRTADEPAAPVREGYLFRGWNLNGTAYDFSTAVNGNITLVAAWEKIVFGEPDFILPDEISLVEEYAFEGVSPTAIYIPDGCREIGPYAFRNCVNLEKVRIPAGCAIGEFAFDGCTHVYVFGTPGGGAEQYCKWHDNCDFVPE